MVDDYSKCVAFSLSLTFDAGDVMAARTHAQKVLSQTSFRGDIRIACLFLTAVCLYVECLDDLEQKAQYLYSILYGSSVKSDVLTRFDTSPMLFLRYAGVELGELTPDTLSLAVDACRQAIDDAWP